MEQKVLRNLDLDTSYYGKNSAVEKVLNTYYPTFDLEMTPAKFIYTNGDVVTVSIKLSRFKVNSRTITPDAIYINGELLTGYEFTEDIRISKQYDIEVVYNGKTSIRTRTICIIYPAYLLFSSETGERYIDDVVVYPDMTTGLVVKAIDDSVHKVIVNNPSDLQYLWLATPVDSMNLLGVMPVGLLNELELQYVGSDSQFVYWRSVDLLNKGDWHLLLNIDAEVRFDYEEFNSYAALSLDYTESPQQTRLLIPFEERSEGLIITYAYTEVVVEEYISTDFSDEEWQKDDNWSSLPSSIIQTGVVFETADNEQFLVVR